MTEALTWLILIAIWCLLAFLLAVPIFYVSQDILGMTTNKAGAWFIVLVPIALLRAYDVKGKIERAIGKTTTIRQRIIEQQRIRKMKELVQLAKMEEEIKLIRKILKEEDNK